MKELKEIIIQYQKMSNKNHPNLLALKGYSYYEENGVIKLLAWITERKSGDLVDMINSKGIFKSEPLTEKQRF